MSIGLNIDKTYMYVYMHTYWYTYMPTSIHIDGSRHYDIFLYYMLVY